MRILKSSLFYFFFYTGTILFFSFFSPVKFFTTKFTIYLGRLWSKYTIFLSKLILGIDFSVFGEKNIPQDKPFLLVSNHQSAWETFFFSYYFNCPIFILKKELKRIPIFSLYFKKIGFIFIDRDKKTHSLKHVIKSISDQKKIGKKIFVIFPEGTRVNPNDNKQINLGFFAIHKILKIPILPLRHNSGFFWKNKKFIKDKGLINVEIFPLIKKLKNKEEAKKEIDRIFKK
tara:strand:- start:1528 stop:2217 length:690 start_codon:yes stop_codon:yes gene_type:complete